MIPASMNVGSTSLNPKPLLGVCASVFALGRVYRLTIGHVHNNAKALTVWYLCGISEIVDHSSFWYGFSSLSMSAGSGEYRRAAIRTIVQASRGETSKCLECCNVVLNMGHKG
jgi:hypothetical protein